MAAALFSFTPPGGGTGPVLASSALEYGWLGLVCFVATLAVSVRRPRLAPLAAALGIFAAPSASTPGGLPELWAAPAHVAAALFAWGGALGTLVLRGPSRGGPGAAGVMGARLLGLGLMWNHTQGLGGAG